MKRFVRGLKTFVIRLCFWQFKKKLYFNSYYKAIKHCYDLQDHGMNPNGKLLFKY